ncbi:hypothetical protein FB45DRAFT_925256, partial [Roridomyces roridus]
TAALWIRHREADHHYNQDRHFGHCLRAPVAPMQPPPPVEAPPPPARMPPPPLPWGYPEAHRDRQWEEEKVKLQELGRQAEDVMTKFSESTLDSIMTTVEALKAKLAEHRAQREQAQRQIEKQLEEQRNNPHRFV